MTRKISLIFAFFLFCYCVNGQGNDSKVVSPFVPERLTAPVSLLRGFNEARVEIVIDSQGDVVTSKFVGGHPALRKTSETLAMKWKFSESSEAQRKTIILIGFETIQNEPKYIDGSKGEMVVEVSGSFTEPNQLKITQNKTELLPKIAMLPRIDGQIEDKYCELHNIKMNTEIVDIVYGLTVPIEGFEDVFEVEDRLFPNANRVVYAGCVVEPIEKKEVYYCEMCRKAEAKWSKERREKLGLEQIAENY